MWQAVGGFSETSYREDWDFHLRLARAGYCGLRLPEPLFTYRHATGLRRRDGSHRREIVNLHKTYSQQELEMACRSCGKRGRTKNMPKVPTGNVAPPRNWSDKDEEGWPTLVYTGKNSSTLVFRGQSGRRYYAGNNRSHKNVRVHPDDFQHLLRFRYFRAAGPADKAQPMTAQPTPRVVEQVDRARTPVPPPPATPDPIELPDLSEMRVTDVLKHRFEELDITNLSDLIAQERANKDRVTVLRHLRKLKERLKDG
jgi:hypothetical protein